MELKYSKDISWHDLPRIIRPSIASDIIEDDLDAPYPQITYSIKEHKFNKIYDSNSRYVDEYELSKLFEKMERGEIYLVKSSSKETFAPLFIWREDKSSKDKGQWEISNPFGGFGSSQIELLLNTVKKPPSGGGGSKPTQTPPPLFPGANTADTQRAVANTGIETVNTATSSARNRELAEHAERYPQLQSGADKNPLEIDKLKYDDDAYGVFAETMAGVGGILATRNPSKIFKKNRGEQASNLVSDNLDSATKHREYLNKKFGRNTGNLNTDINVRGYMNEVEKLDVSSKHGEAIFYSGPGNRDKAEVFSSTGGVTLESTPGGAWLDNQVLFKKLSPDQAIIPWERLSQRYAQEASGPVNVFNEGASARGVFNRIELPALYENAHVPLIFKNGVQPIRIK